AAMSSSSEMAMSSSSEAAVAPASSSSAEIVPAVPAPGANTGKLPAGATGGDVGVAAAGSAADGFGYGGGGAGEAASCGMIGTATSGFAVITTSTFRDGPSASYGNFGALANGKATVSVGGSSGSRTIAIEQTSPDALTIDGKAYVRCTP